MPVADTLPTAVSAAYSVLVSWFPIPEVIQQLLFVPPVPGSLLSFYPYGTLEQSFFF